MKNDRVLYIEDNPGDQMLIEQMISECETKTYDLEFHETLAAGLAALDQGDYEFILLDLNLPDSSGLDTLQAVCDVVQDTPIIVFTGQGDLVMGLKALKLGAEDFLNKGELTTTALLKAFMFARERMSNRITLENSEKEHRVLSAELKEANSLKEMLIDILTHDLKNPAGAILGLADFLRNNGKEEKIGEAIHESAEALLLTISRAVSFSQLAMGESLSVETINVYNMVNRLLKTTESRIIESGMTYENSLSPDLTITANPIIDEVVANFLNNAVKYASGGQYVGIESREDSENLTLIVTDKGETILEKDRQKIFKRSVQLSKGKSSGSGLGLAIVTRIAKAHGGKAWVEPNVPVGNRFCLRLPKKS